MKLSHLRLESLAPTHAEGLFAALADPRVGKYIGGPDVTSLEELEARIAHLSAGPKGNSGEKWHNYVVLSDSEIIGRVEATSHDQIVEIAYLINPRYWGLGLGTLAAKLLIEKLQVRGERDFWATIAPENQASKRVLEKLSFVAVEANTAPKLFSYDVGDVVYRLVIEP